MKKNSILFTIFLLHFFILDSLHAEVINKTICKKGTLERSISHRIFEKDGAPCDIFYEKPLEGNYKKSEWTAKNEPELCSNKYTEFVTKLSNLGWSCKQQNFNYSPVLQIVSSEITNGEIYTSKDQYIGEINEYFALNNGENKFLIQSDHHSKMSIEIDLSSVAKLKNIKAWDGFTCPKSNETIPNKSLEKWTVSGLKKINQNHYKLFINTPEYTFRKVPNCLPQTSFLSGLQWKSTVLTLNSNVNNAQIYQEVQSGNYEVVQGVNLGSKFNAIYRDGDEEIVFILKKPSFANCMIKVSLPVMDSDSNICNMIKIQDVEFDL